MEIIKGLTNEAYRAMDGLSASDIKALLANPYKFKRGIKRPASTAQNIGSAVHSLILEPENFERDFIIADFDRRTKSGKEQAEQAEAYVIQVSNHLHVSQVVAYYAPQVPVYTPETLGAASPYENIHLLEERPEEERCLAVLTDPDTEPEEALFPGYRGTKLGTYFAAYDTFDLWLLELP